MTTIWTLICGAFAFLVGDLFLTKNSKDKLQDTLDASKYKTNDTTLAEQQATDASQASAEQKVINNSTPPTSVPELSPDQVVDFWNNKK
jgi:hypothetical protein